METAHSGKELRIAVLGAGMSGLAAVAKLKQAGYSHIDLFEKSDGAGGTWRDNTYPGCGCDVPSHLYSYSFDLNPGWDYKWSLQPQILQYFEDFADRFGVRPHCHFNSEIMECRYDEAGHVWRLTKRDGSTHTADVLVSGLGQLNIPSIPDFRRKASFAGPSFHSARWDHSAELDGKTVCVIGNGPSAVQFVPEIQKRVGRLINFQRSPAWCRPRGQRKYSEADKLAFANQPWRMQWYRWRIRAWADFGFPAFHQGGTGMSKSLRNMCLKHLEAQVKDPEMRARLTPDFEPGCKRILISDDYYPALIQPNVEVLRQGVREITQTGVVGEDGIERKCDVIIYATGFQSTEFLTPMHVYGRAGTSLNQVWKEGAEAYKGVAVAGFPNFFLLYGPNTNLGHNSIILMVEHQLGYVLQAIDRIAAGDVAALDVKPDAMKAYNDQLQADLGKTVWAGDCASWYKTASGKVTNNWSGRTTEYGAVMRDFDPDSWQVIPV